MSNNALTHENVLSSLGNMERKAADRKQVNQVLRMAEELEARIEVLKDAERDGIVGELSGTIKEGNIPAVHHDNSGKVMWAGFWLWIVILIYQVNVNGFGDMLLAAIPAAVIVAVLTMIISMIVEKNDKKTTDAKSETSKTNSKDREREHYSRITRIEKERGAMLLNVASLRETVHENMQADVEKSQKIATRLTNVADYKISVSVEAEDSKTKGKPRILWHPSDTRDFAKMQHNAELAEIDVELRLYSNEGSLITKDFEQNGKLLHRSKLDKSCDYIDNEPQSGTTLNYSVVLEAVYEVAVKTDDGKYRLENIKSEYLITNKRVTVPIYHDEAALFEKEVSDNTLEIKRQKYREKFEKTMREMSGDQSNPDDALKATIAAHKTKRAQVKQTEEYAQTIVTELTDAGASEEEVEEALEDFYSRLEA